MVGGTWRDDRWIKFIRGLIKKSEELPKQIHCPDCNGRFGGKVDLIRHMWRSKVSRNWPGSNKGARSGSHTNEKRWLQENGELIPGNKRRCTVDGCGQRLVLYLFYICFGCQQSNSRNQ